MKIKSVSASFLWLQVWCRVWLRVTSDPSLTYWVVWLQCRQDSSWPVLVECLREQTGVEVRAGRCNFRSSTAHRLKNWGQTDGHVIFTSGQTAKRQRCVFTSEGEKVRAPSMLLLLQEEVESTKEAPSWLFTSCSFRQQHTAFTCCPLTTEDTYTLTCWDSCGSVLIIKLTFHLL